jgi:hypothetical protein
MDSNNTAWSGLQASKWDNGCWSAEQSHCVSTITEVRILSTAAK